MTTLDPTEFCEAFLRREVTNNTQSNILQSESAIAERLLARRLEMMSVYAELHRKLGSGLID